jgi:hypothetical protein
MNGDELARYVRILVDSLKVSRNLFLIAFSCIFWGAFSTAKADIANLPSYDSPDGYDFATTFPSGSTTIGTFTFTPVNPSVVTGITITGSFGNGDVPTTALSDYYLGFAGDLEAVEVAACDDILANCYSGQEGPYTWTATLTPAEIAALAPGIADGTLDFSYTWGNSPAIMDFFSQTGYDDQYVYAGATTLVLTPEPTSLLLFFSALVGIVVIRRFRRV